MTRVSTNPADDYFGTALGDGSLVAGAAVGIDGSTGKFVAINPGTAENFVGFIEERYDGETTTVDGEAWPFVRPRSGKVYYVKVGGLTAALSPGDPLSFGNGVLTAAAGINSGAVAIAERDIGTTDSYGYVRWL